MIWADLLLLVALAAMYQLTRYGIEAWRNARYWGAVAKRLREAEPWR